MPSPSSPRDPRRRATLWAWLWLALGIIDILLGVADAITAVIGSRPSTDWLLVAALLASGTAVARSSYRTLHRLRDDAAVVD